MSRLELLAQDLAEQGLRLLPAVACLIVVIPLGRQDVLQCVAGAGPVAERARGLTFPRNETAMDMALADARVIESTDPRVVLPHRDLDVSAVATIRVVPMASQQPLPHGAREIGAVAFLRIDPRPFDDGERRLLDDFGALIRTTLQRELLTTTELSATTRLQLAVDVALDLARSLDVGEVVRRLVRRAAAAAEGDRCALLRLVGGDVVTIDAYDRHGHRGTPGYRRLIGTEAPIEEAVRSRAPVLGGRPELARLPRGLRRALRDVRHTVTMPLLDRTEVVGILVLSRRTDRPFSNEDLERLVLMGGPAALALRNAFLYRQVEEVSRVKTDFLDMAVHELRVPLTVISGYVSILREGAFGSLPPAWTEPIRIIDRMTAELRRLADDLLLAAWLEAGSLRSELVPVDLRWIVEQVARAAEDAQEALVEVVTPHEPVVVRGDSELLSRLLEHLVANALNYGRDGMAPWCRVQLSADLGGREARIHVVDHGRGLPEGAESRIFERFTRLLDPDEPITGGTGLGLYIARELALRHSGRLELEWTRLGAGSSFVLRLPLDAAETEA